MSPSRIVTIVSTSLATIFALLAFFFIPLSLVTGHPQNIVFELAVLVGCVWYIARVMRADRRARHAEEAALPPERRPAPQAPRQPEAVTQMHSWPRRRERHAVKVRRRLRSL